MLGSLTVGPQTSHLQEEGMGWLGCLKKRNLDMHPSCKKMLAKTNKVLLYPEEGWARSAASSYWTLTPCWWSSSRCSVVEVAGTRRYSTRAKMMEPERGSLYIVGSFHKSVPDPHFKLWLTSSISTADHNMGYCMTGSLDRGDKKSHTYQTTHFAVIRNHS